MDNILNPCPKCGSEVRLESDAPLSLVLYFVRCPDCGTMSERHPNRDMVVRNWNCPNKTPEEIKKGLRIHGVSGNCFKCPFQNHFGEPCSATLANASLSYIKMLEENERQVSKALCGKENASLDEILLAVEQLKNPFTEVQGDVESK